MEINDNTPILFQGGNFILLVFTGEAWFEKWQTSFLALFYYGNLQKDVNHISLSVKRYWLLVFCDLLRDLLSLIPNQDIYSINQRNCAYPNWKSSKIGAKPSSSTFSNYYLDLSKLGEVIEVIVMEHHCGCNSLITVSLKHVTYWLHIILKKHHSVHPVCCFWTDDNFWSSCLWLNFENIGPKDQTGRNIKIILTLYLKLYSNFKTPNNFKLSIQVLELPCFIPRNSSKEWVMSVMLMEAKIFTFAAFHIIS